MHLVGPEPMTPPSTMLLQEEVPFELELIGMNILLNIKKTNRQKEDVMEAHTHMKISYRHLLQYKSMYITLMQTPLQQGKPN